MENIFNSYIQLSRKYRELGGEDEYDKQLEKQEKVNEDLLTIRKRLLQLELRMNTQQIIRCCKIINS